MTTYTITVTSPKTTDVPAPLAGHVRLDIRTRKPESRAYTVDVPLTAWPDVSEVPTVYRSLVASALIEAGESVLQTFVTSTKTAGNRQLPAALLSLDSMLASAESKRMTAAVLIGMWRNSCKYRLQIAPKLTTLQGSKLLQYKAAIERHEKRLAALCGKSPETSLSADDLDKIMLNMADEDADTPLGAYFADRTEQVRAKLADDSDAL